MTEDSTFTEAKVLEALRVCFDPELPVNIVDLGLVYSVTVEQDTEAPGAEVPGTAPRFRVSVVLTMRAPNDEREAMLLGQVSNRLAGMREVSLNTVELLWEPPWTADRMSDAARRQLGLDRPARQGLVEIKLA